MAVRGYEDLIVWQKALDLVAKIYERTSRYPKHELFGVVSQIRRAAASVPSNIAEGQGRLTTGEFKHFLGIARGSLMEVETFLYISVRAGYITQEELHSFLTSTREVARVLNGLLESLDHDVRRARAEATC